MARSRNIKPGFFKNYQLADLGPHVQLLFAGLWCLADRDGLLEDKPRLIKAELFPYYDVDVNGGLTVLSRWNFIRRYVSVGMHVIQIVNFKKHQTPHKTERASTLPKPENDMPNESIPYDIKSDLTVDAPLSNGGNPPDSLIHRFTDSLIQSQTLTSNACPASQGDHAPQVENKNKPEDPEPDTTTEPAKPNPYPTEQIPYSEIITAYREALPELAGVQRITDQRKRRIKTLWLDRKKAGKYATTEEGVSYWKRYFTAARQSDFLMGRMDGSKWSADFDFLLSEKGFNGVIDGKYKNREAA